MKEYISLVATITFICIIVVVALLIIFIPEPCEHEDTVMWYSFVAQDSTAYSYVRPYCRDCSKKFQHQLIKGELVDKSYLSAIEKQDDGREFLPGEYYTVTATAPVGFSGSASDKPNLRCRAENEDYIVSFTVEFREEFDEQIKSIGENTIITFRGRFYDKESGFTDCELISVRAVDGVGEK